MTLTKEEIERAEKEKLNWEKKATYWHTALPNFNQTVRGSLTEDVKTAFTYEQLELNKSLSMGIRWNNRLNILLSLINLIFFGVNTFLFFKYHFLT